MKICFGTLLSDKPIPKLGLDSGSIVLDFYHGIIKVNIQEDAWQESVWVDHPMDSLSLYLVDGPLHEAPLGSLGVMNDNLAIRYEKKWSEPIFHSRRGTGLRVSILNASKSGAKPLPLARGEIAINTTDQILFLGDSKKTRNLRYTLLYKGVADAD